MMEGWAIRQARVGVSVTLASRSDTGPGPEVQMRTGKNEILYAVRLAHALMSQSRFSQVLI